MSTRPGTREAAAVVVGAGDNIGAAVARRFAAEGYAVVAGRRQGEKLAPLVAEIEAEGGCCIARTLDARQEDQVASAMDAADAIAPLEVCIFNVGGLVRAPLLETSEEAFRTAWDMACYAGFLTGREAARVMLSGVTARSSSPAQPPVCAAGPASPPSLPLRPGCARSRNRWRASSGRATSMSRIW